MNPDVARCECSRQFAINHWHNHGRNEGRQYKMLPPLNTIFDYRTYLILNPDVIRANLRTEGQALQHYILNGRHEKRVAISPEINEYYARLDSAKPHYDKIASICADSKEIIEGNVFAAPEMIVKQLNLYHHAKMSSTILEIGFNAGHSTLIYLFANPTSKIYVFDLGNHGYTRHCFNYLNQVFPNRLSIIYGDSTKTIPEFVKAHPQLKIDLFHIDGGHTISIATQDLNNCRPLASIDNIVIFDDVDAPWLDQVWKTVIQKKLIKPLQLQYPMDLSVHKHAIGQYI